MHGTECNPTTVRHEEQLVAEKGEEVFLDGISDSAKLEGIKGNSLSNLPDIVSDGDSGTGGDGENLVAYIGVEESPSDKAIAFGAVGRRGCAGEVQVVDRTFAVRPIEYDLHTTVGNDELTAGESGWQADCESTDVVFTERSAVSSAWLCGWKLRIEKRRSLSVLLEETTSGVYIEVIHCNLNSVVFLND